MEVKCPAFSKDGEIPKKHTGFGEDISPEFVIKDLKKEVQSLSIIMDDLDVPFIKEFNHWTIWNIPKMARIAEKIPSGEYCWVGVKQGISWGKNRYRGPKQPPFIKKLHHYRFAVYALDCMLNLSPYSKKSDLLKAMSGHIVEKSEVIGWYKP